MKTKWILLIACIVAITIINTSCQKQTDYSADINALKASRDSLAAALKVTNANLLATNTVMAGLSTSISTIQAQLTLISGQITTLNTQLTATNATVAGHTTTIATIQSQIKTIQDQIAVLSSQQTATMTLATNTAATVDTIQNQLTTILGQVATLNALQTATSKSLADISTKLTLSITQLSSLSSQLKELISRSIPTNGLVAWYPFNGNANDESGNSNNGTVIGATLSNDRFGNSGKAYSFNGISNYINFDSGNTSKLNVIGDITLSFWFKSSQTTAGAIFSFGEQTFSGGGYLVGFNEGLAPIGTLAFATQAPANWHYSSTKLNDNNWHNAIITLKAATLSLYVDGKLDSQYLSALPTLSWNGLRRIGAANYILAGFYNGILDDMGIWNRALSQQEVSLLYVPN